MEPLPPTTKVSTKERIFSQSRTLFAQKGYDGLRMRGLAALVHIPTSVLYHYYPSKDELLEEVFLQTNRELGLLRQQLPEVSSAEALLKQRIHFQFDHCEDVVFVLKYYLQFRAHFQKNESGFLPEKSALHIEEVLEKGVKQGEFQLDDLLGTAKIIAHAINGFLLEYYPYNLEEEDRESLVDSIAEFIVKAVH